MKIEHKTLEEMVEKELVKQPSSLLDRIVESQAEVAARYKPVMSIDESVQRYEEMQRYISRAFKEGTDFGAIPGTGTRPTLLLPGAQKLCALFGYYPRYDYITRIEDWSGESFGEPLFYYHVSCVLQRDGKTVGQGDGSCNSWEKKYRYRSADRLCPNCGNATIIKGKEEYGGGWLCFAKKGGCGTKFRDGDKAIEGQQVGQIANPDFADVINTVQKMAAKRALVAAVLVVTGLSDRFTQDIEDVDLPGVAKPIDTGGAPHGTRKAQENVAERKITELKDGAPKLPVKLDAILQQFAQLKGIVGDDNYYAVLGDFESKSGGPAKHSNELKSYNEMQVAFARLWQISKGEVPA